MTAYEFVRSLWENSDAYNVRMDIDTARTDLDNFRSEDDWDVPEDLTAEEYMEIWNALIDDNKEDTTMVINKHGHEIDFDAAVSMMDDEIREQLHDEGYETEQEFFSAYEQAHEAKYGEEWELSKANPVW